MMRFRSVLTARAFLLQNRTSGHQQQTVRCLCLSTFQSNTSPGFSRCLKKSSLGNLSPIFQLAQGQLCRRYCSDDLYLGYSNYCSHLGCYSHNVSADVS